MRRRKNKKKKVEEKSMIGKIIDLDFDAFVEELKVQEVNVGTMNNLILHLEAVYRDLRGRKDEVILLVTSKVRDRDDAEVKKALNGLYAEMTKIEQKVTYLKDRVKELLVLDKEEKQE